MPKQGDISRIAQERQQTEEELLREVLEQAGSIDNAAAQLGVWPYSVRSALAKNGLRFVRKVTGSVERVADNG